MGKPKKGKTQSKPQSKPKKSNAKDEDKKALEYRPKIPPKTKYKLLLEAGNKCANPGCTANLLQIHHIQEWHVYKVHNADEMIAICATCHDHVHRGKLKIEDSTIKQWKSIRRSPMIHDQVYVEPGSKCKMLLGSIYMTHTDDNSSGITIFNLSPYNQLGFRIVDGDILMTNLRITTSAGKEIVRVVDGNLKTSVSEPVRYDRRPGRYCITAPATPEYLPEWVLQQYSGNLVDSDNRFTILDLEVLGLGVIQVKGVWIDNGYGVIFASDYFSVKRSTENGFIHFRGYGEKRGEPKDLSKLPEFQHSGPLTPSIIEMTLKKLLLLK